MMFGFGYSSNQGIRLAWMPLKTPAAPMLQDICYYTGNPANPWSPRAEEAAVILPHTNTYAVTPDGIRVAVFFTKLQRRLLEPLLAADCPPAPLELRNALATIDRTIKEYVTNARLGPAA